MKKSKRFNISFSSRYGRNKSFDERIVKVKTENSGFGVLKTAITFFITFAQLAFLIWINVAFAFLVKWWISLCFIVSIITCIYVLSSEKNSLSKAVWIIFLLLGFLFAPIIYVMSDERIFFFRARKKFNKIYSRSNDYIKDQPDFCKHNSAVVGDANYLFSAGNFNAYNDTSLEYFSSGTSFFDDLIERLKSAEKFVFMEFFIVSDGVVLSRVLDVLEKKVKCGVDVRLIYDDVGSHRALSLKMKNKMIKAGIKIQPFGRLVPIFSVALNYRDHRKIVVVDGKTAYTGGNNLADEYVNEKQIHGYWKDVGVRLDGKAVDGFTLTFLRQWEYLLGKSENYGEYLEQCDRVESSSLVIPYADGLDYKMPIGKGVYENMISSAKEKIYIMTPYFIIDDVTTGLIINKALSGVDVRIILPEVPDKAFVYGVTRNNAEKLIKYGVKIYCMKRAFVHAKVVLTENSVVVGSINMDLRSFYQQFECAVYTDDKNIMSAVNEDFSSTLELCERITEQNQMRKNILYRIVAGLMQVFAPFM